MYAIRSYYGIAEIVKYGVIRNYPFFEWLEENVEALNLRDTSALLHAIKTSCQTKADIVEIDEKEGSLRAILNYGHTRITSYNVCYTKLLRRSACRCA